jgi:hypothetical protein
VDLSWLEDVCKTGAGAAGGVLIMIGALRARIAVLVAEVRLVKKQVRRVDRRVTRAVRRLRTLPCQQPKCEEKEKEKKVDAVS